MYIHDILPSGQSPTISKAFPLFTDLWNKSKYSFYFHSVEHFDWHQKLDTNSDKYTLTYFYVGNLLQTKDYTALCLTKKWCFGFSNKCQISTQTQFFLEKK